MINWKSDNMRRSRTTTLINAVLRNKRVLCIPWVHSSRTWRNIKWDCRVGSCAVHGPGILNSIFDSTTRFARRSIPRTKVHCFIITLFSAARWSGIFIVRHPRHYSSIKISFRHVEIYRIEVQFTWSRLLATGPTWSTFYDEPRSHKCKIQF